LGAPFECRSLPEKRTRRGSLYIPQNAAHGKRKPANWPVPPGEQSSPTESRSHNTTPLESTENKCPTPIARSNPFRPRAILASSNNQCPPTAARRSAREAGGSLNNTIPSPPTIAIPPSVSIFVRPICTPAARTTRNRPRPTAIGRF
jgi:hypothetical protein